jgi:adenylosuccinate synthase
MKAHIVVGAGYGDEGKGITTDFLCSQKSDAIVIRFSGGQQAGHTVIVDGIKHIFSNFGSGTFRSVPTYFTEDCTIYPVTIVREFDVLKHKTHIPGITFHPLVSITTPYDVFANRECKENCKDGTCGLGVGKTMYRNHETPYKLYAIDLLNPVLLQEKLNAIKEFYHIKTPSVELQKELNAFNQAVISFSFNIEGYSMLKDYKNLIFEGSQGILLDMDHGVFPNVTYANTTSKNAHKVCDILKIKNRTVYYITRAYHTRHGAGVFENEPIKITNNEEEINVFNKWQKEFKTGQLDYNLLNHAIRTDSIYCPENTKFNLVVTCNDQVKEKFDLMKIYKTFKNVFYSFSPESKDFKKQEKQKKQRTHEKINN